MVDPKSVWTQLKRIKFNTSAWGRSEVRELPHILTPDEKIYECVNGIYDGGFALLVSTDMRVLLVDKKPLNYLTVEDLRFDMINEIDYSHRLLGAAITISAGNKTLKFMSYNQQRLRKLIGHVQDRMSELKKELTDHQEDQKQHLAQINQQLQSYLLAQHQQLMQLHQQGQSTVAPIQPVKPSPELADYLFAQSLLQQFSPAQPAVPDQPRQTADLGATATSTTSVETKQPETTAASAVNPVDLYQEGYQEVFGKGQPQGVAEGNLATAKNLEINPLGVAYSKLPMMLRNRKFGRPSFHAHSQAVQPKVPAAQA